jgi:SAM-dependent methyltransferase
MNKTIELLAKKYIPDRYLTLLLNTRDYLRSLFYWGDNFICPICNGHFRKFLTYGLSPRPNALCPRCGSLERHRLIWLYLAEKTNFFTARLKVHHFAPERCFQGRFKSMSNLDYITADLNSPFADRKIDITAIPFEDETFDCVLCSHVLEHVPDDRKAMREIYRILKRGVWHPSGAH